jgi:DNA-binding XRE family transcriptional regulator
MIEIDPAAVAHLMKQLTPQAANHSVPIGDTSSVSEQLDQRTAAARQVKAARALLAWDQATLAERAGVSLPSVKRIETGAGNPQESTEFRLHAALTAAGVEFIEGDDSGGPGVRLRR